MNLPRNLALEIGNDPIPSEMNFAIGLLPPDLKAILNMYYFQELEKAEIAALLSCSRSTVNKKIYHALYILKKELNPKAFEIVDAILYPKHFTSSSFSGHDPASSQNDF
jgi:hypothetical protein